jgi:hypothetical protein
MSCNCKKAAKAIKGAAVKGSHIAQGFTSLSVEKLTGKEVLKYARTDERIKICRTCEFNDWRNNNKRLWCGECGCFVPAKARVKDEKCPKGFWEILENGN